MKHKIPNNQAPSNTLTTKLINRILNSPFFISITKINHLSIVCIIFQFPFQKIKTSTPSFSQHHRPRLNKGPILTPRCSAAQPPPSSPAPPAAASPPTCRRRRRRIPSSRRRGRKWAPTSTRRRRRWRTWSPDHPLLRLSPPNSPSTSSCPTLLNWPQKRSLFFFLPFVNFLYLLVFFESVEDFVFDLVCGFFVSALI